MIDREFLRTLEDERARIGLLRAVMRWGGKAKGFSPDFSVVAFGSLIRGDYWKGSDLDIMPIGGTAEDRSRAIDELGQVAMSCGVENVEKWDALSRDFFNNLMAVPPRERKAPYPVQFGLHGFDTIGHHLTILGSDRLVEAAFPEGAELKAHAAERLRAFNTEGHDWRDQKGDAAPEAIKAAVLLASVSQGLAPSRHKYAIVALFEQLVPEFNLRQRWKDVWLRYKNGEKPIEGELEFRDALIAAMSKFTDHREL